jgi:hypothetical protein
MKINHETLEFINSNKFGILKYDRANCLVFGKFEGTPSLEKSIGLLDPLMLFAQKNLIVTGVYDLTQVHGTFTASNAYLSDKFLPTMMSYGYKYASMATSSNPFTNFAINTLVRLAGPRGFTLKMFSDLPSCEKWIFEQAPYKEAKKAVL